MSTTSTDSAWGILIVISTWTGYDNHGLRRRSRPFHLCLVRALGILLASGRDRMVVSGNVPMVRPWAEVCRSPVVRLHGRRSDHPDAVEVRLAASVEASERIGVAEGQ